MSLLDLSRWALAWADGSDPISDLRTSTSDAQWISMPSVVELPHQCDRVWRGIRSAHRKLVLNADGSPWLFFDLENDPLEMNNLVADAGRAAEIAELKKEIDNA